MLSTWKPSIGNQPVCIREALSSQNSAKQLHAVRCLNGYAKAWNLQVAHGVIQVASFGSAFACRNLGDARVIGFEHPGRAPA
jgi:hypothetical protein